MMFLLFLIIMGYMIADIASEVEKNRKQAILNNRPRNKGDK